MPFDPKRLKYSKDGIPILRADLVESIAIEVLQKHCPNVLKLPGKTPVIDIIQALGKTTNLKSVITDLGFMNRSKILGKVSFTKKHLLLDTALTGEREVQMRFTAAHELGHWILHRWNYKNWTFQPSRPNQDGLEDDEKSLCRLQERTPQDWLEWQANVFAAALVMPRATFPNALIATQLAFGISKRLGTVWVSDAEYSQRDLQQILNRLGNIYGVSQASVRVRLNTLKLLKDETVAQTRRARDILKSGQIT